MTDPRVGAALRSVRIRKGWRQSDVARQAGVARAIVSRLERGRLEEVGLTRARRAAAALDVRLDIVPRWRGGELERMLNARHAALHEAAARALTRRTGWSFVPELSFSIYGERGVIDLVGWHAGCRTLLVVELKTEIVDVQGLIGTVDRYRRVAARAVAGRSWNPERVATWVLVAAGRANARALSLHRSVLRAAFPTDGRSLAGWLADPKERVDGLSFLPYVRQENTGRALSTPQRVRVRADGAIRAGTRSPRVSPTGVRPRATRAALPTVPRESSRQDA